MQIREEPLVTITTPPNNTMVDYDDPSSPGSGSESSDH